MNNQSKSSGEMQLSVKGVIGIITLIALGGGALALTRIETTVENNAEGGSVGDININSN
jgi:hypothetical protein